MAKKTNTKAFVKHPLGEIPPVQQESSPAHGVPEQKMPSKEGQPDSFEGHRLSAIPLESTGGTSDHDIESPLHVIRKQNTPLKADPMDSFERHSLSARHAESAVGLPDPNAEPPIHVIHERKPMSKVAPTHTPGGDTLSEIPLKSAEIRSGIQPNPVDEDWTIHNILRPHTGFGDETNTKILNYLAHLDLLSADKLKKIRESSAEPNFDLVDCVLQNKFMTEAEIGQALAAFFNKPYVSFRGVNIPAATLLLIPKEVSLRSGVVAYEETKDALKVAMVNPNDTRSIDLLAKKIGKKIDVHTTTLSQVEQAIKLYPSEFEIQLKDFITPGRALPLDQLAQMFDSLVLFAFQRGASDVHIEPFENEVRIRFRVDGVLHIIATLPRGAMETVVNHIKVLAHLRIDTHSASQDGRFKMAYEKTTINFRVSIMPTYHGEKVVLRLLTSEMQDWTLADLGYQADDQAILEKGIAKSNGMILITGPTGSGKTTTLYALLKALNNEGINLSTIEDPIEYGLPGIVQIQVNPLTNITYAEGLKSLMRQDPDILMIGEIRDFDTGKIAVNAALTGHLVLSTLHTNNSSLAPLRLLQMGVDPYLVVTTVNLIVAQRLARKICNGCMTSYTLGAKELADIQKRIGLSEAQTALFKKYFIKKSGGKARLYKGAGCDLCGGSGYRGRTVIAETLKLKDNIRELILHSRPESEIEAAAIQNGMTPLFEDGLKKVIQGVTTLEEVLRVINQ